MNSHRKDFWRILSLSGALSVLAYTFHVVAGGILWPEYNPMAQAISDLTAQGAPNAGFLRIITTIYGILAILFSVSLYRVFLGGGVAPAARVGALLVIIMEVTSLVGYGLFPIAEGAVTDFQNTMHIVVTAVVVLCTLGSVYLMAAGLMKSPGWRPVGIFLLVCAVVITVSGIVTPITMAAAVPVSGLVERINIFTLQLCILVLSLILFAGYPESGKRRVQRM